MRSGKLALVLAFVLALGAMAACSGCSSQEYTPADKTPVVSPGTILEEGVLKVGVNAQDNVPFAGTMSSSGESSSRIVGLDVDIAAAIADNLGLKLEVVDVGSDVDAALANGQVDIVMGVRPSDTQISCWKSDAYVGSAVALFAADASAAVPAADSAPLIAAQSSTISAWEVTNQYGDASLVSANDLSAAFDDLASGGATYVAADIVKGSYAANSSGVAATPIALMQSVSGYCIGVLDTNTDLKMAISDALSTLTGNGIIAVVEAKWLGEAIDPVALPLTDAAAARQEATPDAGEDGTDGTDGTDPAEGADPAVDGENLEGADGTEPDDGAEGSDGTEPVSTEGEPAA